MKKHYTRLFLFFSMFIISLTFASRSILVKSSLEPSNTNPSFEPLASLGNVNISLTGNAQVDAFFAGNGTDGLSIPTAYHLADRNDLYNISLENVDRIIIISNCSIRYNLYVCRMNEFLEVKDSTINRFSMISCNNNSVHNNLFSIMQTYGISGLYISFCSNIQIAYNHFSSEEDYHNLPYYYVSDMDAPIHLYESDNSEVIGNVVEYGGLGVYSDDSDGLLIADNEIHTDFKGIWLSGGDEVELSNNSVFSRRSLYISEYVSNLSTDDLFLNGALVKIYNGTHNADIPQTSLYVPEYIFLECDNISIRNFDMNTLPTGFQFCCCENITVTDLIYPENNLATFGLSFQSCSQISLSNILYTQVDLEGIYLDNCDDFRISNVSMNVLTSMQFYESKGISLSNCNWGTIYNNTIFGGEYGIEINYVQGVFMHSLKIQSRVWCFMARNSNFHLVDSQLGMSQHIVQVHTSDNAVFQNNIFYYPTVDFEGHDEESFLDKYGTENKFIEQFCITGIPYINGEKCGNHSLEKVETSLNEYIELRISEEDDFLPSYHWCWEIDNRTYNTPTIYHRFSAAGTYNVTVTIWDEIASWIKFEIQVQIVPQIFKSFSFDVWSLVIGLGGGIMIAALVILVKSKKGGNSP